MKKLLMSSLVLLIFSVSLLIFQVSCQKNLDAQTNTNGYILPAATTAKLGGVIVGNGLSVTSDGVLSATANGSGGGGQANKILYRLWGAPVETFVLANSDGTNPKNIVLPYPDANGGGGYREIMLSPDGKRLFYSYYDANNNIVIASCNTDTSDAKILVRNSPGVTLLDVR